MQVKVSKVASFVGKISWSDLQQRKPRIFCPTKNYPLWYVHVYSQCDTVYIIVEFYS